MNTTFCVRRFELLALSGGGSLILALSLLPSVIEAQPNTSETTSANVLYVAPAGICGGPSPCHASVQAAVDAADTGDEIRVATGTYIDLSIRPRNDITITGVVTQVVYISKTLTIRGGYTIADWNTSNPDTNPTTLDAQGQGRVLYITGDSVIIIEGLRITHGDANGLGGDTQGRYSAEYDYDAGGGVYSVYNASVVISRTHVFSNTAETGGGLYKSGGVITLTNSIITDSIANGTGYWNGGGGLYVDGGNATLLDNIITGNKSQGNAGGVLIDWYGEAVLIGNTISNNVAGYASQQLGVSTPALALLILT